MRVGIVSFDFDGTLTNYFELTREDGIKTFHDDMQTLRDYLYLIKAHEKLDRIYLCLNTNEGRFNILRTAFASIFNDDAPWLVPGLQFLAGQVHSYSVAEGTLSDTINCGGLYKNMDKLGNLEEYALTKATDEEVVSVTHVEDGRNYSSDSFKSLNEVNVDTYVVNLPQHAGRKAMLSALKATFDARIEKHGHQGYVKP